MTKAQAQKFEGKWKQVKAENMDDVSRKTGLYYQMFKLILGHGSLGPTMGNPKGRRHDGCPL